MVLRDMHNLQNNTMSSTPQIAHYGMPLHKLHKQHSNGPTKKAVDTPLAQMWMGVLFVYLTACTCYTSASPQSRSINLSITEQSMHGKYLDGNTFVVELDVQITFTLWKYESPAVIKVYSSAPFDVQTYGEPPIILEERIFLVNDTTVHLSIHADFLERENALYIAIRTDTEWTMDLFYAYTVENSISLSKDKHVSSCRHNQIWNPHTGEWKVDPQIIPCGYTPNQRKMVPADRKSKRDPRQPLSSSITKVVILALYQDDTLMWSPVPFATVDIKEEFDGYNYTVVSLMLDSNGRSETGQIFRPTSEDVYATLNLKSPAVYMASGRGGVIPHDYTFTVRARIAFGKLKIDFNFHESCAEVYTYTTLMEAASYASKFFTFTRQLYAVMPSHQTRFWRQGWLELSSIDALDKIRLFHEFGHWLMFNVNEANPTVDTTLGSSYPCGALTDPTFAFVEAYADFFALVATGSKDGKYHLSNSPYVVVPVEKYACSHHNLVLDEWRIVALMWDLYDTNKDCAGDDDHLGLLGHCDDNAGCELSAKELLVSVFDRYVFGDAAAYFQYILYTLRNKHCFNTTEKTIVFNYGNRYI